MGCAVHWFSKVQRSVSMSSTEAEWFAAMVAAREGMYFRDLLAELGVPLLGATALRSDNRSVKDLSLDSVAFKKTKHILLLGESQPDAIKTFLKECFHSDHGVSETEVVIMRNSVPNEEMTTLLNNEKY